jgi:hypothetical protein
MNYVRFKKDGLYSKEYDENGKATKWAKANAPIYVYFQSIVEIDKRVTLGDIIHTLIVNEADIDAMFMGCTRGRRLRPYYDEMLRPPSNKRTDLSHLEIIWVADYYRADNFNHENELYLGLQVNGVSRDSQEANYHALSRAPLNDWKHLKVELNDTLMVNEFISGQQSETGTTSMHVVTLLEARKEITLYDLICGLLSELTMYGYPEQRMERMGDIQSLVEHMEDEDLLSTLQQKEADLKDAIGTENYEQAAQLKMEIDNLKKFLE